MSALIFPLRQLLQLVAPVARSTGADTWLGGTGQGIFTVRVFRAMEWDCGPVPNLFDFQVDGIIQLSRNQNCAKHRTLKGVGGPAGAWGRGKYHPEIRNAHGNGAPLAILLGFRKWNILTLDSDFQQSERPFLYI
jgi:hypothetical protein